MQHSHYTTLLLTLCSILIVHLTQAREHPDSTTSRLCNSHIMQHTHTLYNTGRVITKVVLGQPLIVEEDLLSFILRDPPWCTGEMNEKKSYTDQCTQRGWTGNIYCRNIGDGGKESIEKVIVHNRWTRDRRWGWRVRHVLRICIPNDVP